MTPEQDSLIHDFASAPMPASGTTHVLVLCALADALHDLACEWGGRGGFTTELPDNPPDIEEQLE